MKIELKTAEEIRRRSAKYRDTLLDHARAMDQHGNTVAADNLRALCGSISELMLLTLAREISETYAAIKAAE